MPEPQKNSPAPSGRKAWIPEDASRTHVTVPGLLWRAVQQRWEENLYSAFPPYALELVCYDLRELYPHLITQPISRFQQPMQDAIDRLIVKHYEPGKRREKCLLLRVLREEIEDAGEKPSNEQLSAVRQHVYFRELHRPCIEKRWRDLGYRGISSYVTGLIRYDLALGGMHHYFNGEDSDPAILQSLDAETAATFREGKTRRIRLLDFVDEAKGRKLNDDEYKIELGKLLEAIKRVAVKRSKRA